MNGVRLTFEEVVNIAAWSAFLSERVRYSPPRGRRRYSEYHCTAAPLPLPARLTHLRRSRAARASYGDPVFARLNGGPPPVGPNERLFLLTVGRRKFRNGAPFPIVCARTALVAADGTALAGAETPIPPPFPTAVLEQLSRQFAEAVLGGSEAVANRLLTPACRRRLGKTGVKRLWPPGWAGTVRHVGRKKAVEGVREYLTVEVEPGGEPADDYGFRSRAPDVPPNSVRGVATVYHFGRDSDVDPMCFLYFVEEDGEIRIGHAEPN